VPARRKAGGRVSPPDQTERLVGVVSLTEARAGALIGFFISVTTIPGAQAGIIRAG
jgi:hypothetical protein